VKRLRQVTEKFNPENEITGGRFKSLGGNSEFGIQELTGTPQNLRREASD
jgi:hypothetical protein